MANEADIIELHGDQGDVVRYTIADINEISKGTLMKVIDPRTVSGAIGRAEQVAGITAEDKVANDGATTMGVYTHGIFDILVNERDGIRVGRAVVISGANQIAFSVSGADFISGAVLGHALESGDDNEVIAVRLRI